MRRDELEAFKSRINEEMSVVIDEGVLDGPKKLLGDISNISRSGYNNAKQIIGQALTRKADKAKEFANGVKDKVSELKDKASVAAANASAQLKQQIYDLKHRAQEAGNRISKKVGDTASNVAKVTAQNVRNALDNSKNTYNTYNNLRNANRENPSLKQEKENLTNRINAKQEGRVYDDDSYDYSYNDKDKLEKVNNRIEQNQELAKNNPRLNKVAQTHNKIEDNTKELANKLKDGFERGKETAKGVIQGTAGKINNVINPTQPQGQEEGSGTPPQTETKTSLGQRFGDGLKNLKDNFKSKDPKQLKLDFKAAEKAEKEQQKQADEEAKKAREVKVANDGQTKLDLGGLEGKTKTIDPEKKPLMDKVKDGLKNVTDKFKKPEAEEQQPKQPEVQNDDTNDNTNITSNTNRRKFQLGDKDVSLPKLIKYQQMDDYDSYGRDAYGFDKDGFYRNGFNRKGINKETGTQFDKDGFNIYGFDKDGINKETGTQFDKDGFDLNGFDKNGFDSKGFDKNNINKETGTEFDKDGFNINGLDKDGFNKSGYNEKGVDREGYSHDGFNKDGYDRNGFDTKGFNKDGVHKETGTQFNKDGFNKDGYSKYGFNKSNFNKDGINKFTGTKFDKDGYDSKGFNKAGFDRAGYDSNGFNKAGFNKEGISKETGTQFNKAGFDKDGFDKDGFDKDGFNIIGYNKEGFNRAGYDKHGRDNYGFNKDGFDEYGISKETGTEFNKEGFNKDGIHKETGTEYNKDGFDKYGNPDPSMQQTNTTNNQQQTNTTNNQQTKKSLKDTIADAVYNAIKGTNKNMQYAKNVINKKIPYVAQQGRDEGDAAFAANNPNIPMGNNNQQQNQQAAQQPQQQQMSPNPYLAQAQAAMAAMYNPAFPAYAMPYMMGDMNYGNYNPQVTAQTVGQGLQQNQQGTTNPTIPPNTDDTQNKTLTADDVIRIVQDTLKGNLNNKTTSDNKDYAPNAEITTSIRTKLENGESPDSFSEEENKAYEYYNQNGLIKDGKLVSDDDLAQHFTSKGITSGIIANAEKINKNNNVNKGGNKSQGTRPNNVEKTPDSNIEQQPAVNNTPEQPQGVTLVGEQPTQSVETPTENNAQYNDNDIEKVRDIVKDGILDPSELPGKYKDIYDNVVSKENPEDLPKYTDKEVNLVKELVNGGVKPSNLTGKYKEIYDTMLKDGNAEEIDNSKLSDGVKNVTETPEYNKAFVTRVRNLVKNGTDPNTLTGKYKEVYDNVISKETSDEKPQVNPQGVKNNNQGESEEVTDNQESVTQDSQDNNQETITNKEQNPPANDNNTTTETENTETVINPSEEQSKKADAYVPKAVTVRNFREHIKDENNLNKLIEKVKNGGSLSDSNSKIAAKVLKLTGGKTDKDSIANALRTLENGDDSNYKVKRQDNGSVTFNQGANEFSISEKNVNTFYDIANKIQKAVQDKKIEIDDFGDLSDSKVKSDGEKISKLLKDLSTTISGEGADKDTQANTIAKMIAKGTLHIKEDDLDENGNPKFKMIVDKRPWETQQKQEEQYWNSAEGKKEQRKMYKTTVHPSGNAQGAGTPASGKNNTGYGNGRVHTLAQLGHDLGLQRGPSREEVESLLDMVEQGYIPEEYWEDDERDKKDPKGAFNNDEKAIFKHFLSTGLIKRKYNFKTHKEEFRIDKSKSFRELLGRRYYDLEDNENLSYKPNSGIYTPEALEYLSENNLEPYTSEANEALKGEFKGDSKKVYTKKALKTMEDNKAEAFTEGADDYLQDAEYKDELSSYIPNSGVYTPKALSFLSKKKLEPYTSEANEALKKEFGKNITVTAEDIYTPDALKVLREKNIKTGTPEATKYLKEVYSAAANEKIYTADALKALKEKKLEIDTPEATKYLKEVYKDDEKIYTSDALKALKEKNLKAGTSEANDYLRKVHSISEKVFTPEALTILKEKKLSNPSTPEAMNKVKEALKFKKTYTNVFTKEAINNMRDTGTEAFTNGADDYLQHADYKDGYELNKVAVNDVIKDEAKISALVTNDKKGNRLKAPLESINTLIEMVKDGINFKDAEELKKIAEDEGIIKNEQEAQNLGKAFIALKDSDILEVTTNDKNEKTGFKLSDNRIGKMSEDKDGNYSFEKDYKTFREFHNPDKDEEKSNIRVSKGTGYTELRALPKGVLLRDFDSIMDKISKGKKIPEDDRLQETIKTLKENGVNVYDFQDGYRDFTTGKIVLEPKEADEVNVTNFEFPDGKSRDVLFRAIEKLKNGDIKKLNKSEKKHLAIFREGTKLSNKNIVDGDIHYSDMQKNADNTWRIANYNVKPKEDAKVLDKKEVETKGLGESIMALRLKQKIMNLV